MGVSHLGRLIGTVAWVAVTAVAGVFAAILNEDGVAAIAVAVVGLIGILYANRRTVRRVETKVDETKDKLDTGVEKDIGYLLRDIAQTQEILSAQIHTNTKELLIMQGRQDSAQLHREAIDHKLDLHIAESGAVHRILLERTKQLTHLDEDGHPLPNPDG